MDWHEEIPIVLAIFPGESELRKLSYHHFRTGKYLNIVILYTATALYSTTTVKELITMPGHIPSSHVILLGERCPSSPHMKGPSSQETINPPAHAHPVTYRTFNSTVEMTEMEPNKTQNSL